MVGAVGVDSVLWERALPPGVDAADAVDVEIDVEVDEAAAGDVGRMTWGGIEILLAVIPGADTEGLETYYSQFSIYGFSIYNLRERM